MYLLKRFTTPPNLVFNSLAFCIIIAVLIFIGWGSHEMTEPLSILQGKRNNASV